METGAAETDAAEPAAAESAAVETAAMETAATECESGLGEDRGAGGQRCRHRQDFTEGFDAHDSPPEDKSSLRQRNGLRMVPAFIRICGRHWRLPKE
jgi:hypothetical protein